MWNRDEFRGKTKKFKGRNNRKTVDRLDVTDLENEDELEQIEDEIQETIGDDRWRREDTGRETTRDP